MKTRFVFDVYRMMVLCIYDLCHYDIKKLSAIQLNSNMQGIQAMKCKIVDENAVLKYGLILPNHECCTYYRWTDLKKAKQDAQKVADGWHEYIEVAEIARNTIKVVFVAKPKSEIAQVPHYNYYGNRTWDTEWKTDSHT